MRYGLQFVPQGAFAQDVALGIQLQDEPVVVVPEECPECPPGACEVECYGWDYFSASIVGGPAITTFGNRELTITHSLGQESALVLIPQGEWSGHRTQFVVDPGAWDAGYEVTIASGDDGESSILITFHAFTNYGAAGTVTFQIDLTDAAPGGETWTDICDVATVSQAPPG
jgi:hypothetical protein